MYLNGGHFLPKPTMIRVHSRPTCRQFVGDKLDKTG
jgi:hypothetical protein